jgi:adenine-specific DNA-methyltransferase
MPDKIKPGNVKTYRGNLSLDWYGKDYAIVQGYEADNAPGMVPPPRLNWVNKDGALFYEIDESAGKGVRPIWVKRGDIRVHEARPLVHVKTYTAVPKKKSGTLCLEGDSGWEVKESTKAPQDFLSGNMLIKGDNLLALNTLKRLFAGKPDSEKVKCIYIDPPYNTGSAFKHYDDNLERSTWLTLMKTRLELLRELLREDGSIWINLDDSEAFYFKLLCDEVFGSDCFIATVIWRTTDNSNNNVTTFSLDHNYIFVYGKTGLWKPKFLQDLSKRQHFKNPDNDPRGPWFDGNPVNNPGLRPNLQYEIKGPFGDIIKSPPNGWRWSWETIQGKLGTGEMRFSEDGKRLIRRTYLNEMEGLPPSTLWIDLEETGHNRQAKYELKNLFPDEQVTSLFTTPKPEKLLNKIIELSTDEKDIVLDCFSGSGTTGAVAQKLKRRWIQIEIGNHADTHIVPRISIGQQGQDKGGISKAECWSGGGSFSYYHLGESILKIDKDGYADLNWSTGREWLEGAILAAYDFRPLEAKGEGLGLEKLCIGKRESRGINDVAIVSLWAPGESEARQMIGRKEWEGLWALVKKEGSKVFLFTNRGLEIAADSKPDALTVIRVPEALCTTD